MNITTAQLPIEMYETKTGVVIGSKFNGSQEFRDTNTGTFYSSIPVIDGFMERLQAQILEWNAQEHKRVRREVREGGYATEDVRHWPQPQHTTAWSRHVKSVQ